MFPYFHCWLGFCSAKFLLTDKPVPITFLVYLYFPPFLSKTYDGKGDCGGSQVSTSSAPNAIN